MAHDWVDEGWGVASCGVVGGIMGERGIMCGIMWQLGSKPFGSFNKLVYGFKDLSVVM